MHPDCTGHAPARSTIWVSVPNRLMTHIATQQTDDDGNVVEWARHVSDEEYAQAPSLEEGGR